MTVSTGPLSDQRPYFFAHFWGWCRSSSEKNIENFLFLTWQQEAISAFHPGKAELRSWWRNCPHGWSNLDIRLHVLIAKDTMWVVRSLMVIICQSIKVWSWSRYGRFRIFRRCFEWTVRRQQRILHRQHYPAYEDGRWSGCGKQSSAFLPPKIRRPA